MPKKCEYCDGRGTASINLNLDWWNEKELFMVTLYDSNTDQLFLRALTTLKPIAEVVASELEKRYRAVLHSNESYVALPAEGMRVVKE